MTADARWGSSAWRGYCPDDDQRLRRCAIGDSAQWTLTVTLDAAVPVAAHGRGHTAQAEEDPDDNSGTWARRLRFRNRVVDAGAPGPELVAVPELRARK